MFDSIKNALNLQEDDVLATKLYMYRAEDHFDDDPVGVKLELVYQVEDGSEFVLAEITGDMYGGMNHDYCLVDFAKWMDDLSADQGIAGELACQYYKQNYSDPHGWFPGSVLYVRHITLKTTSAKPEARGVILENVGALFGHCTGTRPGVVTMIFDKTEQDIKESVLEEELIVSSDGTHCFVDVEGGL